MFKKIAIAVTSAALVFGGLAMTSVASAAPQSSHTISVNIPNSGRDCAVNGSFDYNEHTSDFPNYEQADWEVMPSCETVMRVEADTAFHKYYSGWVESLELNNRATAWDDSSLTLAWFAQRAPGSSTCSEIRLYPTLGTWFTHSC